MVAHHFAGTALSAAALLWGAEDPVKQLQLGAPADLILAADVSWQSYCLGWL